MMVDLSKEERRSIRVKVHMMGSPPLESTSPWYPPHLYPPWYPCPYHYPYATPPVYYTLQADPRTISHPSASKRPTRSLPYAAEISREKIENNRSAQPGEDRTERNLLIDFEQTRSENVERNEVEAGGGDGRGNNNGDGDHERDEDWNENSSKESRILSRRIEVGDDEHRAKIKQGINVARSFFSSSVTTSRMEGAVRSPSIITASTSPCSQPTNPLNMNICAHCGTRGHYLDMFICEGCEQSFHPGCITENPP